MKTRLLLLVTSVAIALAITEYAFRNLQLLGWQWPNSAYWYKAKWLEQHQRETTGNHMAPIDTFHPVYGWVLKPNLRNHTDYGYAVSSNSAGMRGTQEYQKAKGPKLRIMMLGDSFMFGECVADSQTIPASLQQLMPHAEVLNMAVHGWGIDQILLRYEREGRLYQPDVVVLGCFNDDLLRCHMWFRDYAKPYFELEKNALVLQGVPVTPPQQLLQQPRSKLLDIAAAKLDAAFNELHPTYPDPLADSLLSHLVQTIQAGGARPVLLYIPWLDECKSGVPNIDEAFVQLAARHRLPLIDPVTALHSALQNGTLTPKDFDCHYSPAITALIARQLATEPAILH